MSDISWIEGVEKKFLTLCDACCNGEGVCTCPSPSAFRMILGHVIHELKQSWTAEADAWNRGYEVCRSMERGRKS